MSLKCSIVLSGIMFWAVAASLSAQTVTLDGQLLTEDTRLPLPEVEVTVISLTKPLSINKTTTGTDGRFTFDVSPGISYRLCSAAAGRYAESCQFSKPLTVKVGAYRETVQMTAPAGIRMRVRIVDADGLLSSPDGSFIAPDPLLLHVFAEEARTRTHIPLQLEPSPIANEFEASVVIPTGMEWDVAMSSVHAQLLASDGNPYQANTPIPRPQEYGDSEFLAVFTLRAK